MPSIKKGVFEKHTYKKGIKKPLQIDFIQLEDPFLFTVQKEHDYLNQMVSQIHLGYCGLFIKSIQNICYVIQLKFILRC